MFENGWWGGCIPTSLLDLPMPARITMSLTTMPTSRFGFSMMWGKFCHSCFEITPRTALEHFTLKTSVRFQKGGGRPPNPPWVRHCLAVPRTDDRFYMTGSIHGWRWSHLTYMPGDCWLEERKLTSQSSSITVEFSISSEAPVKNKKLWHQWWTGQNFLAWPIRRETTRGSDDWARKGVICERT